MKNSLLTEVRRLHSLMGLSGTLTEEKLYEITSKDAKERYYPKINDYIYAKIVALDPTYNQTTDQFGKYDKWLLNADNLSIIQKTKEEDYYKIRDDLSLYDRLKNANKLPAEYKDINAFNITQLANYIFDNYTRNANFDVNSVTSQTQDNRNIKKDADKYVVGDFTIINPKTEESACFYGKGTKWCTAAINDNRFDQYNREGKIWILIDKYKPNEKLQFHFESEQFMDAGDREIDIGEFFGENDDVYNFFAKMYPNIDYLMAKRAAEKGMYEDFNHYYSNEFDDGEKEEIIDKLLDNISGGNDDYGGGGDAGNAVDMLSQIRYDFKEYKDSGSRIMSSTASNYRYALEGIIRYDGENSRYNDNQSYATEFIHIFGGLTEDDIQILYDNLHQEGMDTLTAIVSSFDNGMQLLNQYIIDNDLGDEFKTNDDVLKAVIKLQKAYPAYPVLETQLVKITINGVNYEDQTFSITLERKPVNGQKAQSLSGSIDYRNIYNYLNNYSLFEHKRQTQLIIEVRRMRSIMELRNNETTVKMRKGVPYRDVTAPPNGDRMTFTGNETGVVIAGSNMNGGDTQVQLTDGRVVLTTDDAVEDANVGQDVVSIETNDINDSGMNNSMGTAGGV